jgi:hypothetical protein
MTTCPHCNANLALVGTRHRCIAVVHSGSSLPDKVVHKETLGSSRHGKYADPEARKRYRREWMRKKRLGSHPAGVT